MVESILPYERSLFFLINHSNTTFLDNFMWLASKTQAWIPLFALLLVLLVRNKNKREWFAIIVVITLVFVFCDQFSSSVCKPIFTRLRPTHHPDFAEEVRTLFNYRGGKYGFISSHASNAFGFATISALLFKKRCYTIAIFTIAFIISYSRVYLGVHFISDVVTGALSGVVIGSLMYQAYKLYVVRTKEGTRRILTPQNVNVFVIIIISYIFSLMVYSSVL